MNYTVEITWYRRSGDHTATMLFASCGEAVKTYGELRLMRQAFMLMPEAAASLAYAANALEAPSPSHFRDVVSDAGAIACYAPAGMSIVLRRDGAVVLETKRGEA